MQLSYKLLRDPNFMSAMRKLANHPNKNPTHGMRVAKLIKALDAEQVNLDKVWADLIKVYALKDEKGELVPRENIPNTFQIPDDKKPEWEKAVEELMESEFTAKADQLALDKLEDVGLTALELLVMDPILLNP